MKATLPNFLVFPKNRKKIKNLYVSEILLYFTKFYFVVCWVKTIFEIKHIFIPRFLHLKFLNLKIDKLTEFCLE